MTAKKRIPAVYHDTPGAVSFGAMGLNSLLAAEAPKAVVQRLGILGDVHAEHTLVASALRHFQERGTDCIVAVGDLMDGFGDAEATLRLLSEAQVVTVAGNHDRWWLKSELRDLPDATPAVGLSEAARAYVTSLPRTRELQTPRGTLMLCHGVGANDFVGIKPHTTDAEALEIPELRSLLAEPRVAFLVNGHTHRPMLRQFARTGSAPLTVLNAGTLHRNYRSVCAIADFAQNAVEFFDLDAQGARSAARWALSAQHQALKVPERN